MNEEEKEYLRNDLDELFTLWSENGVNTEKPFSLLLSFYRAEPVEPSDLVNLLEQEGYEVNGRIKRTMIIFRGYKIMAEKTALWSRESLISEVMSLAEISKKYDTKLENYMAAVEKGD